MNDKGINACTKDTTYPCSQSLQSYIKPLMLPCTTLFFVFFFFLLHYIECGILLIVPWPGIEPGPPVLKCRVLTSGPPGKSLPCTTPKTKWSSVLPLVSLMYHSPLSAKAEFCSRKPHVPELAMFWANAQSGHHRSCAASSPFQCLTEFFRETALFFPAFIFFGGFADGSAVKNAPAMQETGLILGLGRFPWRRKWQPTPGFFPGKFHVQRNLASYNPWGHKESDTT